MSLHLLTQLKAIYDACPTAVEGYATDDAIIAGAVIGLAAVYLIGCPARDSQGRATNRRAPLTMTDTLRCTIGTAVEGLKTGVALDLAWLVVKPTWNYLVAPGMQIAYDTISSSLARHFR